VYCGFMNSTPQRRHRSIRTPRKSLSNRPMSPELQRQQDVNGASKSSAFGKTNSGRMWSTCARSERTTAFCFCTVKSEEAIFKRQRTAAVPNNISRRFVI
jgi:hypothetical protein